MNVLVDNFRRLLAANHCGLCGAPQPGGPLCGGCHESLPWLRACCGHCALPLPEPGVCPSCLRHPPPFQRTRAALRYEAPVDRWITDLKFHGRLDRARLLGRLMADTLAAHGVSEVQGIVPVPLHGRRLRRRGYNQALEIARVLGTSLKLPVIPRAVQRHRHTAEQTTLSGTQRRRNLRGAFRAGTAVKGKRVALLDDVMTTGATAAELARGLRAAGAESVEVWVVARAA